MDGPRSVVTWVFLILAIAFLCVMCLAFISLTWRSEGAIWLKLAATVGLLAVVAGGTIRLVIASRPYGDPR
jgi:hypothetical protein